MVSARGTRVTGFFDGMKPDPRVTVRSMLAHRHPPSACQQQSGSRSLSWIDRLLSVEAVHASSCLGGGQCTGAYWYTVDYHCPVNIPAGCVGATLVTSEYGGSAWASAVVVLIVRSLEMAAVTRIRFATTKQSRRVRVEVPVLEAYGNERT